MPLANVLRTIAMYKSVALLVQADPVIPRRLSAVASPPHACHIESSPACATVSCLAQVLDEPGLDERKRTRGRRIPKIATAECTDA